jgi:hypothetical protein
MHINDIYKTYKRQDGFIENLRMNYFPPECSDDSTSSLCNDNDSPTMIVLVRGGAFMKVDSISDSNGIGTFIKSWTSRGYALVAPDYTVATKAPENTLPKDMVTWMRKHFQIQKEQMKNGNLRPELVVDGMNMPLTTFYTKPMLTAAYYSIRDITDFMCHLSSSNIPFNRNKVHMIGLSAGAISTLAYSFLNNREKNSKSEGGCTLNVNSFIIVSGSDVVANVIRDVFIEELYMDPKRFKKMHFIHGDEDVVCNINYLTRMKQRYDDASKSELISTMIVPGGGHVPLMAHTSDGMFVTDYMHMLLSEELLLKDNNGNEGKNHWITLTMCSLILCLLVIALCYS